jgi:energy-coupling factor transporter ATP-binding protein EcfA2
MRDRIVGLLEKADLAAAGSEGVVDQAYLMSFAAAVRDVRTRMSYPDDVLVVALLGGTGSGKSSILNAIAGTDLAQIGGVRPTTSRPLVVLHPIRAGAMLGYLDSMGIEERRTAEVPQWLCLIDMPDTDSVELDHRYQVESLLSRVDVMVWVVDPEKYRDEVLHNRYLTSVSAYRDQLVFVLNQVDRLSVSDAEAVRSDFLRALADDGIEAPSVFLAAANPPVGPAVGVEGIVDHLGTIARSRSGTYGKLMTDLDEATRRLLVQTGGASTGFEESMAKTIAVTGQMVSEGDRAGAIDVATSMLEKLAAQVGGPLGQELLKLASDVPNLIDAAANTADCVAELESTLATPARILVSARATANALITDLAIELASVETRMEG